MNDTMKTHFVGYGKSDTGNIRRFNEDSYLVDHKKKLFAIADGVGGEGSGKLASDLAIQRLGSLIADVQAEVPHINQSIGHTILERLDKDILEAGSREQVDGAFASTLSALIIRSPETALLMHAGDSRIYGYQSGHLKPLTEEHTLANELRLQGQVEIDSATEHALVNCLGKMRPEWNEVRVFNTQPYQALMICSDGLSKSIKHTSMEGIIAENLNNPYSCIDEFIRKARDAGAEDNITVIIVLRDGDNLE